VFFYLTIAIYAVLVPVVLILCLQRKESRRYLVVAAAGALAAAVITFAASWVFIILPALHSRAGADFLVYLAVALFTAMAAPIGALIAVLAARAVAPDV
jgi:hypothetical protein